MEDPTGLEEVKGGLLGGVVYGVLTVLSLGYRWSEVYLGGMYQEPGFLGTLSSLASGSDLSCS